MSKWVVVRTTPQSTIVVGSQHIEDIQKLMVHWHKSAETRSKIDCMEHAECMQKQA
jgi:hypothetical protein